MRTQLSFANSLLKLIAGGAVVAVVGLPAAASAQSYNGGAGYGVDRAQYGADANISDPGCAQARTGRTVAGGLVGGVAGALLGNQLSGHSRGAGTALGGVVGAVAGAAVGRGTAKCNRDDNGQAGYGSAPSYAAPAQAQGYNQDPSYVSRYVQQTPAEAYGQPGYRPYSAYAPVQTYAQPGYHPSSAYAPAQTYNTGGFDPSYVPHVN